MELSVIIKANIRRNKYKYSKDKKSCHAPTTERFIIFNNG